MADPDRFAIVLVRPQEAGNIGATARAMANMGRSRLILVDPQAHIDATARAFAVHAGKILEGARIEPDLKTALAPFERVVGTTAGRGRTDHAVPIPADHLPTALSDWTADTALVFGGEASGLTTDELAMCHPLVTVPCSMAQPTLNLAQAVLLVCYELAKAGLGGLKTERADVADPLADQEMIEGLFADLVPLLETTGFARDDTFEATLRDLRRLAARSAPSEREVSLLRGILRRFRNALATRPASDGGDEGDG